MAKRDYSRLPKIQPSVLTFEFETPTIDATSTDNFYIDLSQCASYMNRRAYRQGLNWAVASIDVTTSKLEGWVRIGKLPNTWVMSNAWEKSFRAWQKMIKNATDEAGSESIKGKFLDFKIFIDDGHHSLGVSKNLLPLSFNGNTVKPGPWDMSIIDIPVTQPAGSTGPAVSFELVATGANNPGASPASGLDAKSVIQGYADSRALPHIEDPNQPADAPDSWIMKLFSDGNQQDEEVTEMLLETGIQAPYAFEGGIDPAGGGAPYADTMYPGGETNMPGIQSHAVRAITGTTIGGTTFIEGGNFPCGLIRVELSNGTALSTGTSAIIRVNLVPGAHRGYLAESMTDM